MSSALPIVDVPSGEEHDLPPITARYLLLTIVPSFVDERGDVWLDRLWHHDLIAHFAYLKRVALAAPAYPRSEGPKDLVKLEVPPDVSLTFVPLPAMDSTLGALARIPALAWRLWRAIGEAEIVHSGVAGWPVPPGWVANPMALARGRKLVLVVESAPWRLSGAGHEGRRARVRAIITEALARLHVQRAHVNLFTQPDYQRTLAAPRTRGCHVTPATWINAEDVANAAEAAASWAAKRREPVRLLFAARMLPEKGVDVLIDALERLEERGVPARVDAIGEGPRREALVEAAARLRVVELSVLDPVAYGAPFFDLVRRYHAVLVPNLGDEQPRIVFDAFAQAVPVIAFDTDGLRPHVRDGETGWILPRGSAIGLSRAIERASRVAPELERMGRHALEEAPRFTHRGMHHERWRIFTRELGL